LELLWDIFQGRVVSILYVLLLIYVILLIVIMNLGWRE
jgi:hypothetical protein